MIYIYTHRFFWGLGPSGYAWTSSTDFWCYHPIEQLEQGLQAGLWCVRAVHHAPGETATARTLLCPGSACDQRDGASGGCCAVLCGSVGAVRWATSVTSFGAARKPGHACHLGGEDGEMGSHWLRCDVYCIYIPYNLILGFKMGRQWIHNLVNSSCRSNNFGIFVFPCCESVNHSPQLTSVYYSPQLTSVPPESRKNIACEAERKWICKNKWSASDMK